MASRAKDNIPNLWNSGGIICQLSQYTYLHPSLDATSTAFGVKKTHDNMAKPVPLTPEKKITDDPMIVADPEPVAGAMDDLDLEGMPDPLHSDRMDHSN
jgi:hypothetical protein